MTRDLGQVKGGLGPQGWGPPEGLGVLGAGDEANDTELPAEARGGEALALRTPSGIL